MGSWYRVTKKINGRLYDYWQRTERDGNYVKTYNKYIGPSTAGQATITSSQWNAQENALRAAKQSFPQLDCRACAMERREGMRWRCPLHYNPIEDNARAIRQTGVGILPQQCASEIGPLVEGDDHTDWGDDSAFIPEVLSAKERCEGERIQYCSLKARNERQAAAVRKAKRNSAGTGAVNPFVGQAIKQDTAQNKYPGWRHMTAAQRYNAKKDMIFDNARQTNEFIKAVLANDENSTDEELIQYFVSQGFSHETAKHYVDKREYYLKNL